MQIAVCGGRIKRIGAGSIAPEEHLGRALGFLDEESQRLRRWGEEYKRAVIQILGRGSGTIRIGYCATSISFSDHTHG